MDDPGRPSPAQDVGPSRLPSHTHKDAKSPDCISADSVADSCSGGSTGSGSDKAAASTVATSSAMEESSSGDSTKKFSPNPSPSHPALSCHRTTHVEFGQVGNNASSSHSHAPAVRKTAGNWRGPRIQTGHSTPQTQSGGNSPLRGSVVDLNVDEWDGSSQNQALLSPPGSVEEIPSINTPFPKTPSSLDIPSPWADKKTKSAEYDWANFVYAYARGKWDPSKLPQPPGRSNLNPGMQTRIGSVETSRRSETSDASTSTSQTTVRPSLDYRASSDPAHIKLAESGRRAMLPSSSMPPQTLDGCVPPSTAGAQTDARFEGPLNLPNEDGFSQEESPNRLVDLFELLRTTTSSAPQVGKAVALGAMTQQAIDQERSGESSTGAKTDSEVLTKAGIDRDFSRHKLKRDDSVWSHKSSSFANQGQASRTSPSSSAIGPIRPALNAQVSELTVNASHTSRGLDVVGTPTPPQRPEPTPLQITEMDAVSDTDILGAKSATALPAAHTDVSIGPTNSSMATEDQSVPYDETKAKETQATQHPNFLSQIGHSNSSPSVATFLSTGRSVEAFYKQHGYLPAISPPDESERRQALRRYGHPYLPGNANFERIAHLVKLVFNTKVVFVSLVGDKTQTFQTQVGVQSLCSTSDWLEKHANLRDCSLCGHTILQPNDEPLVIHDARKDWRFAGNPIVNGPPNVRFYAGSPLRTSDGYNLGSLCLMDDEPRDDFGPRQRHALREFSRVVMREMELIRDTIHLRARDRMQHSIEQFTRKCIEMESNDVDDSKEESTGLGQVYNLAAESMCDALNASGAFIFDLSQFETIVSTHAEGIDDSQGKIFLPSPYQFPEIAPLVDEIQHAGPTRAMQMADSQSKSTTSNFNQTMVPPLAMLGSCEKFTPPRTRDDPVPLSHHVKIAEFLRKHRTGFYYPFCPVPFRQLLPSGMTNLLLVPIFGLNRQPFALLCSYSKPSEDGSYLEDMKESGLQYLRALGTIILSAILKKDIVMADQAKSHFISNISHELRTPLHGILAAAELLSETKLNSTQGSYLDTVEACGKSLLELVNHVLDFTKLSGSSQRNSNVIMPSQRCDLVKLIQEVGESSSIGQTAKNLESARHAGIGSAYAKGSDASSQSDSEEEKRTIALPTDVETVIDISLRSKGWLVKCDAGGIRRVLMNLIGNSLKFTTSGFVHISLREVQSTEDKVIVELGVTDTGKGISRSFLEEQLFHPFTQENHLGPGTGLGLSIVNSIVQSPAINGKIDVWSTQGQGTEIRITCELGLCDISEAEGTVYRPFLNVQHQRSIAFLGFDPRSRGASDLKDVLRTYFEDWWRFKILTEDDDEEGDLVIINQDVRILSDLIVNHSDTPPPPAILLLGIRGSPIAAKACHEYEKKGGVVRTLFKPTGPAKLERVTDFCLQCYERGQAGEPMLSSDSAHSTPLPSPANEVPPGVHGREHPYFIDTTPIVEDDAVTPKGNIPKEKEELSPHPSRPPLRPTLSNELRRESHHISPAPPSASDNALLRRHSSEDKGKAKYAAHDAEYARPHLSHGEPKRPLMPTRSITYHEPNLQRHVLLSPLRSPHYRREHGAEAPDYFGPTALASAGSNGRTPSETSNPSSPGSVVSLEGGEGALLKTAINTAGSVRAVHGSALSKKRLQILSVEDNPINRRVLAAFFGKMDVDFVEATNGEEGVRIFEAYPPFHFDVVFMDLTMPVLDGIGATLQIRKIEAERIHSEQTNLSSWHRNTKSQSLSVSGASGSLTTPGGSRPSAQARAKIFALTGRSSEEDKRRAFSTGADGFIVKPLSFKILSSLLNTVSAYR